MCQDKVYDFLKDNQKQYYSAKELKKFVKDRSVKNTRRALKKLFEMGYLYRRNMKYRSVKNQVVKCFIYRYKKQKTFFPNGEVSGCEW